MQRVLNPEKINNYIKKHMGENRQIYASKLPMETTEDFVKVIYVRLYGQRKNMQYTIDIQDEIEINGYRFKDFKITLK